MDSKLAKIEKASLNLQDRGILTFYISVKYEDGWLQDIGGYVLDTYDKETKTRKGTAYGCEMIRKILYEFGVNDFSELKNKHLWVTFDDNEKIISIAPLYCDNPNREAIEFSAIYEQFKGKE